MPLLENGYPAGPEKPGLAGKIFRGGVILVVLAAVGWGVWIWTYAHAPRQQGGRAVTVFIPPRSSFSAIQQDLTEAGVIAQDSRFRILGRLMGITQSLKAGEYSFAPSRTPYQILQDLAAGKVLQRVVTIPEGDNIYQVAELLAAQKLIAPSRFLALVKDKKLIKRFKVPAATLEGYLFPDTYYFHRGQSGLEILRVMVGRTRQVMAELLATGGNEQGLTQHEILTLASVVEKETGLAPERPLIARVFLNRLQRGMRLQADPTVIYGLEPFDGNLSRRDLKTPSPYNTYLIKGLPSGPIANPGRASIAAVLHPARELYLYFVSKNDGSHYFSKTLAEHNRAVRKYQKQPRRRAPKRMPRP